VNARGWRRAGPRWAEQCDAESMTTGERCKREATTAAGYCSKHGKREAARNAVLALLCAPSAELWDVARRLRLSPTFVYELYAESLVTKQEIRNALATYRERADLPPAEA